MIIYIYENILYNKGYYILIYSYLIIINNELEIIFLIHIIIIMIICIMNIIYKI